MTAKELLKISKEKQLSLDELLKQCEYEANEGRVILPYFGYISAERICDLANLGFKVTSETGQLNENIFIISWL